uniref:Probable tRNA methyltransferase 9B n=2 Tax=Latimeria chalumnae TaxID=7897 RepID=H3AN43_LATCH
MEYEAIYLEKQHVHSVYERTAPYFNDLQSKAWPHVRQFLLDQQPGSLIADIGCGTGKYLSVNSQVYTLGCDYCGPLVEIAQKQGHEVMACDNLNLPFRDQCFNAVISVGVIHHFSTKERRVRAIKEMARVLISGGQLMIYVWAMEQKYRRFEKQDVFVPWNRALCSRQLSESCQSVHENKGRPNVEAQKEKLQKAVHAELGKALSLEQDLSPKRSYSADNYVAPGNCCLMFSEQQESKFYKDLGKSIRTWFFSKSLDESVMKKHIEKFKPFSSTEGWVNNTVSIQPSRHCSMDLDHPGSLMKEQSFEDEVFVETSTTNEAQLLQNPGTFRDLNGGLHRRVCENSRECSSQVDQVVEKNQNSHPCEDAEAVHSEGQRVFKRTPTTDSTDSFFGGAVPVTDDEKDLLDDKAFMRYYHVFREGELAYLLEEHVPELRILKSCYDHGNWCIVAEKKRHSSE